MNKNSLLKRIADAFSDVPYPYKNDFYKAIADREYEEYYFSNKEKKWNEITRDDIIRYYDFLFFLNFNGIVYYLPAYMSLIINYEEVADHYPSECFFMTIADLDINKFNNEQRQTILCFLIYCRDIISPAIELDEDLIEKAISNVKKM